MKNRSNEIRSNEIRRRREPPVNICAVELMKIEIRNSCAGNKKEIVNIYIIFVYEQLCK